MQKVGVLVVSKCLSSAAMIETIARSEKYSPEFFVVEKQANPSNIKRAKVHCIVPDLNIDDIVKFARVHTKEIDFGLTDTEDFVTAGGRDTLEAHAGVRMVCVTKEYAVERSKADQRLLFDEIFRDANPRYRVFDPKDYVDVNKTIDDLKKSFADLGKLVIKPDAPARGAGVGVWGTDFHSEEEMVQFFLRVFAKGRVVVEEKVEGEESSFHAFSDGKHFVPAPLTRDYKRGLDNNLGKLTGGMGSYSGPSPNLPFIGASEWEKTVTEEEAAFRRWKGKGSNPGLRGIVLYDALMHTGRGFKVLERNSRGGNTEVINILTTIADDFVDVCFRILDGSLKGIRFRREASVVTCAAPLSYGADVPVEGERRPIDLSGAYTHAENSQGTVRVFPMDVAIEKGISKMGTSRSVAVVGLGPTIAIARKKSLEGTELLVGPLRWRKDIASPSDIQNSRAHLAHLGASA